MEWRISLNVHQDRLVKIGRILSPKSKSATPNRRHSLEVIQRSSWQSNEHYFTDLDRLALLGGSDVERLNLLLAATGKDDYQRFREEAPEIEQSAKAEYEQLLALLLEERTLLGGLRNRPSGRDGRARADLTHPTISERQCRLTERRRRRKTRSE